MSTFFEVIGFLCVSAFVLALMVALYVSWRVRRVMHDLGALAAQASTPSEVHLARLLGHQWANAAEPEAAVAALRARGFEDAGRWAIDELPGVVLQFLVHAGARVTAVVYEQRDAGTWLDLVTHYEDGGTITYTTSPRVAEGRPGRERVAARGTSPGDLLDRLLAERPVGRAVVPPGGPESVKAVFERAWAEATSWRPTRGGPRDSRVIGSD